MPMFPEGQDPMQPAGAAPAMRAPLGQAPADPFAGPAATDIMGAALRQNNPIASVIDGMQRASPDTAYDPTHNPLDIIRGTKYEAENLSAFTSSPNEATTRSIMAKIDSEDRDRQTLAASGWAGTVAGVGAGLLDPTMYLPFVGEANALREGAGVARSAARMATLGALQSTISELALQASQRSRSTGESLGNIASNTLLMGLLGSAGGLLSKGEHAAAVEGLDAVRQDFSVPSPTRSQMARTGDALIDRVLDSPITRNAIDNPVINRDHDVPYGAGGSVPLSDPTVFIDRHFPTQMNVGGITFDPAEPFAVHENVEQHVMGILIKGGMTEDEAYRVAHFQWAERAEGAWYRAHGIDQAAAEAQYKPILDQIQHEAPENPPSNLYTKPYPHDDVHLAQHEGATEAQPSDAETTRARGIIADWLKENGGLGEPANQNASQFGLAQAAGAAAADQRELVLKGYHLPENVKALPVIGPVLSKAGDVLNGLSPTLRVFSSDIVPAKRAMADLAETPLVFEGNARGETTSFNGPPLDRLVKMQSRQAQMQAADTLHDAFLDYRYGENQPRLPMAQSVFEDLSGQAGGKLSYGDFKAQVSEAMWSGDEHAIPQVQQAAQTLRQKVFRPIEEAAQRTLGPDGRPMLGDALEPPKGDKSFFPRMWNKEALGAGRNRAKEIFTNWLAGEQGQKAAAKDRLVDLSDRHATLARQVDKLDSRMATLDRRTADTNTRLDERSMDAQAASRRVDTVKEREQAIADSVKEVDDFVSTMRDQIHDPGAKEQLDALQQEAAALRKQAQPMSAAELQRVEREEIGETLPGDMRHAAEIYLGRRKVPRPQSILSHMVKNGGISDEGGDVAHAIGGSRGRPGLINGAGRDADAWGEQFFEMAPHAFPEGRPTPAEVHDIISEAAHGREPAWWLEHVQGDQGDTARLRDMASNFEEMFRDAPQKPKTLRDIARALKEDDGRIPAVLDRLQQKVEAGRDFEGASADIDSRKADLQKLRDLLEAGKKERARLGAKGDVAGARVGEAQVAETRTMGRARILFDRLDRQQTMRDLLERARANAENERLSVRGKMEDEIRAWKGNSTADALRALKARDEAERVRGLKQEAGVYEGKGERLTSADSPVDRAVKSIVNSDRDLSHEELGNRADEILDRLLGSPDGRLPYDAASGGPAMGPPGQGQQVRGSLNARDFAIPSSLVKDFIEKDTEHAVSGYLRTVLPDVMLTQRFGDVEMTNTFRQVNEAFAAKAAGLTSERALSKLEAQRQGMIRDLAATRDRVRGVYGWSPDPRMRNAARIANTFRNWNLIADLGTSIFNRLQDASSTVFRYGFMNVMNDVYRPYLKGMLGASELPAASRKQAIAMGTAIDGMMGHMRHQIGDVFENSRPGSKFERGLAWVADKSMLINLHGPWTDWTKTMATAAASAEFLRTAERIAGGSGTAKDIERMAAASIDQHMATRIWQAYADGGGSKIDGVHVPNTGDWKDAGARQAFEAAMGREADIAVITPGAEKPLWMSNPIASLLGQFKSFVAGAHERLLIANLQQRDAHTLQGLLTVMATGMLSYRLYTWLSGREASDRPQDWIKEAISRSAITGWLSEINGMQAKFTAGQTDAYRLIGADHPLSRMQSASALSELLGPTYSHLEGLTQSIGDASRGTWNANDTHRIREWAWMQNLFAVRRLFDDAEDGINNAFGIKPRNRDGGPPVLH